MGTLQLEMSTDLYLGIDFGTTNSVVSIYNLEEDIPVNIPIDGSNIFPTAIQFEVDLEDENKLSKTFGYSAKEGAIIYPDSTVLGVKRLLHKNKEIDLIIDDKKYTLTPKEIVSEILMYLKQKTENYLQEELGINSELLGCVITVPANSSDKQKKLTRDAALQAGFEVVHLRPEPAAAAISYALLEPVDKKILVYDFGGGTFDACVLEIKNTEQKEPNISILSTFGENDLGGNDIDKIIMDIIYEEFKKETNNEIDLFATDTETMLSRQKKVAIMRMHKIANLTKERLSTANSAKVVLAPFIQEPMIVNINIEITREQFLEHKRINILNDTKEHFEYLKDKSVKDLVNTTIECVDKCISSANLKISDIDEIFMVGGSSNIPIIFDAIKAKFDKEPYKARLSPALSISLGAAYYCNIIMTKENIEQKGPVVLEKTLHSFGLEVAGRKYLEIIAKGVEIPTTGLTVEACDLLTTNFDDVTSMAIAVYENTDTTKNIKTVYDDGMRRLGGTSLRGIPPSLKGEEKVQVKFFIGQDNILKVKANSTSQSGVETELSVDELYD